MLRTYGIPAPSEREYPHYAKRLAASVSEVVKAVDQGHIPTAQYDAVLIDEAHDFEPQWLALAAKMVNPRTKALMVVYDDIQAIYKGRERPVWSQLGIEAKGRTTVLKVNYRNTAQIVAFARRFASDVIGAPGTTADDEHAILLPEDAGRQGLVPDVRRCVSIDAEAHCVAEWFLGRKKAGYE
jgi:superfamily I DNA/RNA helicase